MIDLNQHLIMYFILLSVYCNLALALMWTLLEKKNYPIYAYDWIIYFLMTEWFIYKIVFIDQNLHPILNLITITVAVCSFYFIIFFIKEKK